jgi:peptidoglycan/LPS O-acetylase OafA/YrhL
VNSAEDLGVDSAVKTVAKHADALKSGEAVLPKPKLRLEFLDALRGIAALYVVVYHMVLLPEPDLALPYWAKMIALNGGMGVTLFFVVSAFSLYYTMPARLAEPHPWVSFYIHRFFRIAPLFYVWIVLTLVRDQRMFGLAHTPGEIALSATFLFNLVPQGQEGFVWASWTIGIEMLFYAVFPVFYLVANNRRRALSMSLLLLVGWWALKALSIYFADDPKTLDMFAKWNALRHFPVFACGAIAYHVFFESARDDATQKDSGILLVVGALFIYTALLNSWLPNIFGDPYYWQAIVFGMLLVGLGKAPIRIFVNAFTCFLGRVSYSLYLSHPTVILLLSPVYPLIQQRIGNSSVSIVACALLTFAAALTVSELTYRLIEHPGINLGKRLNRSLRNRMQ